MKVRTLIPNIRFRGFSDPWEQRKLESVVIVYDKGRVPVTSTERISGDTPYYGANGIQDYVDGYTHDGEFTLIAEDGANDTRNYPIKFVSGKIWVNNHAHVLAGKQNILNTRFLSFSLQQINIEPFLSGSGRAKLNASEMKKLLIAVPNIYEQIKVENFLGEMAHLIAANEDKVQQLKTLKKLMMQKIFSQEWRFKGFTDPWEQRKFFDNIKQVLDYRGKTPKKLNMKWNEEPKGYLALSAINVKAGYIDKHIETYYASEKLYKKWMGKDSLSAGDILFTTEAPMGNVALVPDKGKYILSQRTIAFKLDKAKLDNLFWLEFLESTIFKSKAVAISSGGTAQGVSQKSLRQVIVIIPSDVNEQKRIGQVLVTVDNLIAANEDKLNQLKRLKKYLMQNLFV
ncbi:restriction endonuclease subunit S [Lactiplantibacillus plantarum]|uniref:restriction endonuclease subunit S n=2 Tax=Lactiplantibacillus plantarum TaxID=1590 RepID=UPI00117B7A86|nr:restriction endonuclease subunit S [Lactiplantibacillus plantarum]MCT3213216.1 restriction endonuclease subunit S [Lactiplantibacillus plantarum]MCT3270240.1 restriction endonuclease subunit S [Lactiplantibacillus plantarum]